MEKKRMVNKSSGHFILHEIINVIFRTVLPYSGVSHLQTEQTMCPQTKHGDDQFPGNLLKTSTYTCKMCHS